MKADYIVRYNAQTNTVYISCAGEDVAAIPDKDGTDGLFKRIAQHYHGPAEERGTFKLKGGKALEELITELKENFPPKKD